MCRGFTFASSPQCQASAGVLFFRRKYRGLQLRTVKHNGLWGQIAMVLPTVCPSSVGLIVGIFWTKSKSPRYSSEVGMGCGYKWLLHKTPKNWDTRKICYNHPKIWTRWFYHWVMCPNNAEGIANSVYHDQTLTWIYTVCPELFVWKLGIIAVLQIYNLARAVAVCLCDKYSFHLSSLFHPFWETVHLDWHFNFSGVAKYLL